MKKIKVHGTIVTNDNKWIYDLFDMDSTSPKDISDALAGMTDDVVIEINSYGGYVDAGNQIYSDLKKLPGKCNGRSINGRFRCFNYHDGWR